MIVFVTGLSGAGKSQAMKSFEDLGFHCLENLLPLRSRRPSIARSSAGIRDVAIALDVRYRRRHLGDALAAIDEAVARHGGRLLFLDAQRRRARAPLQRDAPAPSVRSAPVRCAKRSPPTAQRSRRCASAPTSSSTRPRSRTRR